MRTRLGLVLWMLAAAVVLRACFVIDRGTHPPARPSPFQLAFGDDAELPWVGYRDGRAYVLMFHPYWATLFVERDHGFDRYLISDFQFSETGRMTCRFDSRDVIAGAWDTNEIVLEAVAGSGSWSEAPPLRLQPQRAGVDDHLRDWVERRCAVLMEAARAFREQRGVWPMTFGGLIQQQLLDEEPVDPWGNGFVLHRTRDAIWMSSPGPDVGSRHDDIASARVH